MTAQGSEAPRKLHSSTGLDTTKAGDVKAFPKLGQSHSWGIRSQRLASKVAVGLRGIVVASNSKASTPSLAPFRSAIPSIPPTTPDGPNGMAAELLEEQTLSCKGYDERKQD